MTRALLVLMLCACSTPVSSAPVSGSCAVEIKVEDSGQKPTLSSVRTPSCPMDINVLVARSSDGSAYFLELQRDGDKVHYDITPLDVPDDVNYVFLRKRHQRLGTSSDATEQLALEAKLRHHSEGDALLDESGRWVQVAVGSWEDGKGYRISLRSSEQPALPE
jgi:hypothetical protein